MKKQFFTFLMMIALVIVAGTAMAQTNKTPYQGGTYSYTLQDIRVMTDGKATIEYSGTGATIKDVFGVVGNYTAPVDVLASNNVHDLTFKITYANTATDGILKVTLAEGDGCTNYIELAIDVQALPDLDLAITASTFTCQILGTPGDNEDAASVATALGNTFTYTITPTLTNISSGYTYSFDFDISPATSGLTGFNVTRTAGDGTLTGDFASGFNITGATSATQVFTITFTTTTQVSSTTYQGQIANAALAVTSGNGSYIGDITTGTADVLVKATPKIGTFIIE